MSNPCIEQVVTRYVSKFETLVIWESVGCRFGPCGGSPRRFLLGGSSKDLVDVWVLGEKKAAQGFAQFASSDEDINGRIPRVETQ